MKKRVFISVFALVLAILMLVPMGCSGNGGKTPDETKKTESTPVDPGEPTEAPAPEKSAEELYQAVLEVSGFGTMTKVPLRDYAEIYGIDANRFADQVWYVSDNPSLNADEFVAFLVTREDYVKGVTAILQGHINQRLKVAESYSPEEAGKLRQVQITEAKCDIGTWVYYCVGSEYAKMMEVMRANLG